MIGLGHWMAGTAYAQQKNLAQLDKSFRAALPYIKDNDRLLGPALFQLGLANYQMGRGKSAAMMADAIRFTQQCAAIKGPMQAQAQKNLTVMRKETGRLVRLASLVLLTAISRGAVSDADVQRIHSAAILIDTHNDVPMKMLRGYDIAQPSPRGSTDLARLRAGGVDAVFFAAYVPKKYAATKGASADYCRRVMKAIRTNVAKHS